MGAREVRPGGVKGFVRFFRLVTQVGGCLVRVGEVGISGRGLGEGKRRCTEGAVKGFFREKWRAGQDGGGWRRGTKAREAEGGLD